jgi:hypothetical protein
MVREASQKVAPALEERRRQFDAWRREGRPGRRIPEALWNSAAALAREMGTNPVVQALHLDYVRLKRRVTGQGTSKRQTSPAPEEPTFVELAVDAVSRPVECVVEFEGRGGKVTMRLAGHDSVAIVALAQTLARAEP